MQLSFEDILQRETVLKQKEEALGSFCKDLLLTITAAEKEALEGKDQGIRTGKLLIIKKIRATLAKLPL